MACNKILLFSLIVAFVCLIQVATAQNLSQAIYEKSQSLIKSNNLDCSSYSGFCDSNPYAFSNVNDVNGENVSVAVCKAALGGILQC